MNQNIRSSFIDFPGDAGRELGPKLQDNGDQLSVVILRRLLTLSPLCTYSEPSPSQRTALEDHLQVLALEIKPAHQYGEAQGDNAGTPSTSVRYIWF